MTKGSHMYLSTACLHGEHSACRISCKFCASPCICSCHDGDPRFTAEMHEKALRGRALLMPPIER